MGRNYVMVPKTVVPDTVESVRVGSDVRFFEFHNASRYHVLLRNDQGVPYPKKDFYPVDVCLPYSSKVCDLAPEDEWISYMASGPDGKFRVSEALAEDDNSFWFVGSDVPRIAPASYRGVGVVGQLINVSREINSAFITAKLASDAFNRLEIYPSGAIHVGDGGAIPEKVWDVVGSGDVELDKVALTVSRSSGTTTVVGVRQTGDAFNRLEIKANGELRVGRGSAAPVKAWDVDLAGLEPGQIRFLDPPRLARSPVDAEDAVRLAYLDSAIAALDVVIDTATPVPGGNWGTINSVRVRRYGRVVSLEGRVQNISGGNLAAGTRIVTLPALYCPPTPKVIMVGERSTGAGELWGGSTATPNPNAVEIGTTGSVDIAGTAVAASGQIDLGGVCYVRDP